MNTPTLLDRVPDSATIVALRFSALGDVVLAAAALRDWHRRRPDLRIVLATKEPWANVFREQDWLDIETIPVDAGVGDLLDLARRIRRIDPARVVDLHATLRAHALRLLLPSLPWSRLNKQTVHRWALVRKQPLVGEARHVVERFADVLGTTPVPGPWLDVTPEGPGGIALIPSAAWPTKCWPERHWVELARELRQRGHTPVWLGGPQDTALLERLADKGGGTIVSGAPLDAVARHLAAMSVAIGNDTGPLHLAAAVGTPAIAILGPTVRGFGYTPWGTHRVAELELPCRPCSFHGGERCPIGTHACLEQLAPTAVLSHTDALLAETRRDEQEAHG